MTFLLRPCSTIFPVTVALEASPPVRIFWSSVWTLKIEPNFTCSPTSPETLSTRMVSPGATRYCFPPDLITAYIAPPELKANNDYTGRMAEASTRFAEADSTGNHDLNKKMAHPRGRAIFSNDGLQNA